MTVRKARSVVKTGKAVWWVSLINVWLQPSWLPALLASLASAGWLLCPHLTTLTHTHCYTLHTLVKHAHKQVLAHSPGLSPSFTRWYTHASSKAGEVLPLCCPPGLHILLFLSKWLFLKSSSVVFIIKSSGRPSTGLQSVCIGRCLEMWQETWARVEKNSWKSGAPFCSTNLNIICFILGYFGLLNRIYESYFFQQKANLRVNWGTY